MAIARRSGRSLDTSVVAPPSATPSPPIAPGKLAVPPADAPAPDAVTPAGRLRRCTFRRIDPVPPLPTRGVVPSYEVMCLYGGDEAPLALGDIESARPVCEACTATGIFRPDED